MKDFPEEEKLNNSPAGSGDFEAEFKKRTAMREKERRDYYSGEHKSERARRRALEASEGDAVRVKDSHGKVYAAMRELWKVEDRPVRRQGALTRLIRFISGASRKHREMKGQPQYTNEKRRAAYWDIFCDTCTPVSDGLKGMVKCAWGFISECGHDLREIGLWLGDLFIIIAYYLGSFFNFIADRIWDFTYWFEDRKGRFLRWFITLLIIALGVLIYFNVTTGYEYSYYGKTLGVVRSMDDVYQTFHVLGDKLSEASGTNISLDVERDIEFTKVHGINLEFDSDDDILNTLTYMKELQVQAFAISVDGNLKVVLEDWETADHVLRAIKAAYTPAKDNLTYEDVNFAENVEISEVSVQLGEIWNPYIARDYLMKGSLGSSTIDHTVVEGETLAEIAATYGFTEAQLLMANPYLANMDLTDGTIITIGTDRPLVNVFSKATLIYTEPISYGTRYIDNATLYVGETELKSAGELGTKQITAAVDSYNGNEYQRVITGSSRILEPVDEVKYRGTKPIPPRIGTGTYILPLNSYTVTSEFSWRWGRQHEGMDFGVPIGTKVYACDGGVCTWSGWKNGLGYCVIIDHGGLMTTTYAHCSKLLVSAGDQIYQGQNIALSGNTGNSTGPHLHLEFRYNGEAFNPRNYISP